MQRVLRALSIVLVGLYVAQAAIAIAMGALSQATIAFLIIGAVVVAMVLAMARVLDLLEEIATRLVRLERQSITNHR